MAPETPFDSLDNLKELKLAATPRDEPNLSSVRVDSPSVATYPLTPPPPPAALSDPTDNNNNNNNNNNNIHIDHKGGNNERDITETTNISNKDFKRRLFRPIKFSIDRRTQTGDAVAPDIRMEPPPQTFRAFNADLSLNPLKSRRFSLRLPPQFMISSDVNAKAKKSEGGEFSASASAGDDNFNSNNDDLEGDAALLGSSDDHSTNLMIAAKNNQVESLEKILETKQSNINATDVFGWTALMYACYYGYPDIVKRLLMEGAQAEVYDTDHMSCLHWATGRGHLECVSMLIQLGKAKVNQVDRFGSSALIWACRKGFTEVVALLLKAGANIDCIGMLGWSPVLVSVLGNHVETLKLLLQHKPNVNTCDAQRLTPLIAASKEGKVEIVKMLLKARAFVNLSDEYGQTALIHAVKGSHLEVVDILLKHHADIDHVGADKKTALFWAVEKGNLNVVERLLQSKPNLELISKDGETCLMRAVKLRKNGIVRVLLAHGARVSTTDSAGDTVLHVAVKMRSATLAQLILANPKNHSLFQKQNKSKKTPVMLDRENSTAVFPMLTKVSSKL